MSDTTENHSTYTCKLWLGIESVLCSLVLKEKEKKESEITQSCPTLCDPMDCTLPSSSVHGIFQARVLEWGAISFSKEKEGKPLIVPAAQGTLIYLRRKLDNFLLGKMQE